METSHDEIKQYLHGRYIGPTEAIWRIFEYPVHEEYPPVIHLSIHLPGEQPVYFEEGIDIETLRVQMEEVKTTLMAFFLYNATYEDGRQYLYHEFPSKYTYDTKQRSWHKRKKGFAIGRVYHCNPFMGEKYYLRLLLTTVRGPQSFEHLRTINNTLYPTFKSACIALGLLADDNEWITCFNEAVVFTGGYALRLLFTTALLFGIVADPRLLWDTFSYYLCDDLQHFLIQNPHIIPISGDIIPDIHLDYGLYLIATILAQHGKSLSDFQMPIPIGQWGRTSGNSLITEERQWDIQQQRALASDQIQQLNAKQKIAFDTIVQAVEGGDSKVFFLQGPAGTGKTYVYKTICNYLRGQGKLYLNYFYFVLY